MNSGNGGPAARDGGPETAGRPGAAPSEAMGGRDFARLFAALRSWAERAEADGWLSAEEGARFRAIEARTPGDLFVAGSPRPLVVALFGGTGVGKSSLLNRLAGQAIARTGVERPTSFEVTLYAHEQVVLGDLPPEMPVERVKVARHAMDSQRNVLWMDVPDIDSTHEENRRCALAWLPYVDLAVYVVSPERYRDDVGWRLLLEREHKHGWLFVINRWDEGDEVQREDFEAILRRAGFAAPLVLVTSCGSGARPARDDFDQISETLHRVVAEHGVRELERLGYRARALELEAFLRDVAARFGDDTAWSGLHDVMERRWSEAVGSVRDSVDLLLRSVAARLAVRDQGVLDRLRSRAKGLVSRSRGRLLSAVTGLNAPEWNAGERSAEAAPQPPPAPPGGNAAGAADLADASALLGPGELSHLLRAFWDDWPEARLTACLDALDVELRRMGLAVAPVQSALRSVGREMRATILGAADERVRFALANPAAPWRVTLGKAARWLTFVGPGAALVTVGVVVIYRFGSAAMSEGGVFLGLDFAVHAALLVVVAWALPFAAEQALRPRMERVVLEALRQGVESGLRRVRAQVGEALHATAAAAHKTRGEAARLLERVARYALSTSVERGALQRLIARGGAG